VAGKALPIATAMVECATRTGGRFMYALLLLALGQTTSPPPTRFSVLADPCAADTPRLPDTILVCGDQPRVPPIDRGSPDRPMPSNPDVDGRGAMAAAVAPCATRSEGCTVGVDMLGGGVFLVRAVGKLIDPNSCCEEPGEYKDVGKLLSDVVRGVKGGPSKAERAKRVAIPLDPAVPLPVAAK
jgi:hypothetical protein